MKKEDDFLQKLKKLFDIAPQSVLEDSKVSAEAKLFLTNQRKDTRERYLVPVRIYIDEKERELEILEIRKKRAREEMKLLGKFRIFSQINFANERKGKSFTMVFCNTSTFFNVHLNFFSRKCFIYLFIHIIICSTYSSKCLRMLRER